LTDKQLAEYLGLNDDDAAIIMPKLTPGRRAAYERMAEVEANLNKGIVPPGVIACGGDFE